MCIRDSWAPSADRREILHDAPKYVRFYNAWPKFWRSFPEKFLGAKNMQNLARFRSTSKFGGQFLRNGWRYSKSVSYSFDADSSRDRRNKSGKVWSSNLRDLDVELNPPKAHFSENHILAPRGCCAPQIFTRAWKWLNLTNVPPNEDGGSLYNFFQKGVKNWL